MEFLTNLQNEINDFFAYAQDYIGWLFGQLFEILAAFAGLVG